MTRIASPLGPVPQGWKVVRLKEVTAKIGSGSTPRGGEASYLPTRKNFALIRSQNVFDWHFDAEGLASISDQDAARLDGVALQPGDVLLNITGDGVTFGRACRVPETVLPARVNQHVSIIRPDPALCVPGFLLAYLAHPLIKQYIESFNAGGSRRAITKGHIESFVLPLPQLAEQVAIAEVLDSLTAKIDLNWRMNQTLEAMARALFKSWFVDFDPVRARVAGRRPPCVNDEIAALFPAAFTRSPLGDIPDGWRALELPDAIGINPPRSLRQGVVAPYLDMQNAPTNGHRPVRWVDRHAGSGARFMNGDTLLARITPCLENGKTVFVDFLADGQVGWGSTEFIVLRPKPPLPAEYGYYLARSDDLRSHAIKNMTGSSGRQRVPPTCFNSYLVVVPSAPVAERFGEIVKLFMLKIRSNAEETATLAAIRDALLPKLLSGQIKVNYAEKLVGATV